MLSYFLFHFQEKYDRMFLKKVNSTRLVKLDEVTSGMEEKEPVRIIYNTREQYKKAAKSLGLMDDFKVRV